MMFLFTSITSKHNPKGVQPQETLLRKLLYLCLPLSWPLLQLPQQVCAIQSLYLSVYSIRNLIPTLDSELF